MAIPHLSFFPAPVDGETVYSWLSRYHIWSGHKSFRRHSLAAFDVNEGRAAVEFPGFLKTLSVLSGVKDSWIVDHMTDCHYYQPFLTPEQYQHLFESITQGDTAALQSQLGMVANRLTSGRELWSCVLCIETDINKYGFPIWHVEHQIVGVVSCPVHHQLLLPSTKVKSRAFLPENRRGMESCLLIDKYTQLVLDEFACHECLTTAKIICVYQYRLKEMGFLTENSQLRLKSLKPFIRLKVEKMGAFPGYQHIIEAINHQYPECLFYNTQAHHHPLKHLILIGALFATWEQFLALYHRINESASVVSEIIHPHGPKQNIKLTEQARSCLIAGDSLRSVSEKVCISVATLKILAQQEGIYVDTRPQKIFPAIERAIWRKLFVGMSCTAIAEIFEISIGAVEQILRKHQYLKPLRKKIWFTQIQNKHRKALEMFCHINPTYCRKKIRASNQAAFIWLYRHDQEWLCDQLPVAKPYRKKANK
jgi:hypothetical protein